MKTLACVLAGIAACLVLGTGSVWAEDPPGMDVGFVRLKGLTLEEVKAAAAPLMSPDGKLSFVESKSMLVIHDYPEKIELVKKIVAELDGYPANIRVEVIFDEQKNAGQEELGIDAAGVSVTRQGGKTHASGGLVFSAGSSSRSSSDFTNQYVLTASNRPGQIWVGKSVPDVAWVQEYGARHGWWRPELVFQDVGASLWVLPRLLADGLIEVEVYPRLTSKGKSPLVLDIRQLSTKITVKDGQAMALGGLNQETCQVYSKLLGQAKVFNGSRLTITLRATVMPMPQPPATQAAPRGAREAAPPVIPRPSSPR